MRSLIAGITVLAVAALLFAWVTSPKTGPSPKPSAGVPGTSAELNEKSVGELLNKIAEAPTGAGPAVTAAKSFTEASCTKFKNLLAAEPDSKKLKQQRQLCGAAFKAYEQAVAVWKNRDVATSQITDRRVLSHQIRENLSTHPELSATAAEKLLELEPDNHAAAKMIAVSHFEMAMKQPQSAAWQDLDHVLEKLKLPGKEGEFFNAEMRIGARFAQGEAKETLAPDIQKMTEQYPRTGQGEYFTAWEKAREGDRTDTILFLGRAQSKDPSNQNFRDTRDKIDALHDSHELGTAFHFKPSFGPNDSDLASWLSR